MQLGGERRLRCLAAALPAVRCPARASAWQLPPAPLTAGDCNSASRDHHSPHSKPCSLLPTLTLDRSCLRQFRAQTCGEHVGGGLAGGAQPLCSCVAPVGPRCRRVCTGAPAGVAARARGAGSECPACMLACLLGAVWVPAAHRTAVAGIPTQGTESQVHRPLRRRRRQGVWSNFGHGPASVGSAPTLPLTCCRAS
jgi:hypothetical protein